MQVCPWYVYMCAGVCLHCIGLVSYCWVQIGKHCRLSNSHSCRNREENFPYTVVCFLVERGGAVFSDQLEIVVGVTITKAGLVVTSIAGLVSRVTVADQ